MNKYVTLLTLALCLGGCSGTDNAPADTHTPKTPVSITHAHTGSIRQETILSATTAYLDKSVITAPISSYIVHTDVHQGSRISAGQVLYTLESKEHRALGAEDGNGVVAVRAAHGGIVLDTPLQAGSFVPEGSALCTIADAASLVFVINAPYETARCLCPGSRCDVELPDGTRLAASISAPLAAMDAASQSEQVIARARTGFLPEGLAAKAVVAEGGTEAGNIVIPIQALQCDEGLSEYWVMKLSNDSTAVKTPVTVVRSNSSQAEIKPGAVTPADRIITDGGYGLEDGARINIEKTRPAKP